MDSENIVERYFTARGFMVKARRWRTPFAEVDLLFFHEKRGLWLVEVKTAEHFELAEIIGGPQLARLRRAAEFIAGQLGEVPRLCLAAVNHRGKVEVLPLD